MSKALSLDLRNRVLSAVSAGMSHRAAGARFGVSAASVSRWRALAREQGDARPKALGGDRRSGRIEAQRDVILGLLEERRDITIEELRAALGELIGLLHPGTLYAPQHGDVPVREHFAEPPCIHAPGDVQALAGLGPERRLSARQRRTIRPERWSRIEPDASVAHGGHKGSVPGKQAQCVMTDGGSGPQQDHRHRLVWNLVVPRLEIPASRDKAQAAIFDAEIAAVEPQEAVPVRMRNARGLQAQPPGQHSGISSWRPEGREADNRSRMQCVVRRLSRGLSRIPPGR